MSRHTLTLPSGGIFEVEINEKSFPILGEGYGPTRDIGPVIQLANEPNVRDIRAVAAVIEEVSLSHLRQALGLRS